MKKPKNIATKFFGSLLVVNFSFMVGSVIALKQINLAKESQYQKITLSIENHTLISAGSIKDYVKILSDEAKTFASSGAV